MFSATNFSVTPYIHIHDPLWGYDQQLKKRGLTDYNSHPRLECIWPISQWSLFPASHFLLVSLTSWYWRSHLLWCEHVLLSGYVPQGVLFPHTAKSFRLTQGCYLSFKMCMHWRNCGSLSNNLLCQVTCLFSTHLSLNIEQLNCSCLDMSHSMALINSRNVKLCLIEFFA